MTVFCRLNFSRREVGQVTRRDLIHKWSVYALALMLVWIADAYLLPRYPLFGLTPMLLPAALAAVAVMEGTLAGCGFGLAVGLLWEAGYAGGFGGMVLFLALMGLAAGALSQYVLSQSLPGCLLCTAGILFLLDGFRVLRGLITNTATLYPLLAVAVPECLLSLLWTPLIYLLFRVVFNRVGGTKLA